jgi:hypothetical protein
LKHNLKEYTIEIYLFRKVEEIVKEKVTNSGYPYDLAFITGIVLCADEFDRIKPT